MASARSATSTAAELSAFDEPWSTADTSVRALATDALTLVRTGWRLDRRQFTAQLVLLAMRGVVGGFNLLLLIPIVNSLGSAEGSTIRLPSGGRISIAQWPLWLLLLIFVALAGLSALIGRATAINTAKLQPLIVDTLRAEAFTAVLRANWSYFLRLRRSDIVDQVSIGASRCGSAFQTLVQGAVDVSMAVATLVVALLVSPTVTLIAAVALMALALFRFRALRTARQVGVNIGRTSRGVMRVVQDSLESMRLVRAHDAVDVWQDQLVEAIGDSRAAGLEQSRLRATVAALSTWSVAVAAAALVLIASLLSVPATGIVVMLVLMGRLAGYAQSLGQTSVFLADTLPAVAELSAFTKSALAAADIPPEARSERSVPSGDGAGALVEFRDVTFHYPGTDKGVTDLSFPLRTGVITVLTGHSGAGKSTTADLTLGLLWPDAGEVLVDGVALQREDLRWWRGQIAYVPQETVIIPASLRENLVWSVAGSPSDDECWQALDLAAATFARDLPHGLDTMLGDRGMRLSGGERQRISIARALLRQPRLLVLDEATSSLDDVTESAVLDVVERLVPAMTLLVIAHRQSTVERAHHRVALDHGRAAGPVT